MIGQTLSHYRVTSALGAGGMGEVYRATDTNLQRDVAIKVLPPEVAQDPERLGRFKREAHLLAALNHPSIAAIYGLEEADGKPFLILELVEGEDLKQRLARGAIPVDEALEIAKQVAEALEEAHEKGIVHRDLKPANVKVTPDGKVKVLDFGLAKAWTGDVAGEAALADLSQSPTLAHTGTAAGLILGTAAYMSPEQARGKPVDKRADIWAFGVVLFELLTGRRLFQGETVSDTLAAVLKTEPEWSLLPASVPSPVARLLRRCLERDPRRRLRDIGEARVALEERDADGASPGSVRATSRRLLWAAAAVAGAGLFAAGWLLPSAPRSADGTVRKVDLAIDDLDGQLGRIPLISPDGSRVAYVAGGRLQVRNLAQLESVALPAGDDVLYFCWSPDGRHLAYVRQGRAWKVPVDGGQPTDLGAVPADLVGSGGSAWTSEGRIVFSGSDTVGIWEIPAEGGAGRDILPPDRAAEADFHEIAALPGNRGLIFTVHPKGRGPDTIALLAGGKRQVLLEIRGETLRNPAYSPTGHLLYERESTSPGLWAVPFSLARLETTGAPFLVLPGGAAPSVARDGTLCFVRREESPVVLVRVSRGGSVETIATLPGTRASMLVPVAGTSRSYGAGVGLSLSPDGSTVALSMGVAPGVLSVFDLVRGSLSTVASGVFPLRAVWTPRGERMIYASGHGARAWNLSSRRADGVGEEDRLSTSDEVQVPLALSPDARWLVYMEGSGPETGNLLKMPPDGGPAIPVFPSRVFGAAASFSPDGRWLAHESMESGRVEIDARPFPGGEKRVQLSTGGGRAPVWSRSGEVFYLGADGLYAVSVAARGDSLAVSKPALLFHTGGDTQLASAFDATPDGQHFLMLRSRGREHVSLILNWPRDLALLDAREAPKER
jgi:eukaryotic-like serine/threonine-protein kinase